MVDGAVAGEERHGHAPRMPVTRPRRQRPRYARSLAAAQPDDRLNVFGTCGDYDGCWEPAGEFQGVAQEFASVSDRFHNGRAASARRCRN
jgi:hypothetical protein